jgi:hypothetical protein
MRTKPQKISDNIARKIINNTRKRFSTLYADAQEDYKNMSTKSPSSTVSGMNVNGDSGSIPKFAGRPIPNTPQDLANAAPGRLPGSPSSDSINSGMSVGSQLPTISAKPVDANHLVGSNQGDHRAPSLKTDITAFAKNSPGPRESVGQFKGSKYEAQPPFVSSGGGSDSDAGN